jgi:hypothetical protein
MAWDVEYTDEFELWWASLTDDEQADLDASVELLELHGPQLGRPHVDTIKGSKHSNMKELRTQSHGKPLRTFFAFDPRRAAILLIGGDKTGDARFYDRMVPIADGLFDVYLAEIKNEGLI